MQSGPPPPTLAAPPPAPRGPLRTGLARHPNPGRGPGYSRSYPDNVTGRAPLSFSIYSTALGEPTMHCYFRPQMPRPLLSEVRGEEKEAQPCAGKEFRRRRVRRVGCLPLRPAQNRALTSTAVRRRSCPRLGRVE